jgi:hypothetical protein
MLFLITQIQTPETCPIEAGEREALHDKLENVPGFKIRTAYRAYPDHTLDHDVSPTVNRRSAADISAKNRCASCANQIWLRLENQCS